jgi:hypothetical protein
MPTAWAHLSAQKVAEEIERRGLGRISFRTIMRAGERLRPLKESERTMLKLMVLFGILGALRACSRGGPTTTR